MKNWLRVAFGSLLILLCFLCKPGYSQTFGRPKEAANPFFGTGGFVGTYCSLQIVNGNPAISYYDITNANLKYHLIISNNKSRVSTHFVK
jgi:hypothetical protein